LNEVCIIPKNFPLEKQQKADKRQEEMCQWDFHDDSNKVKIEAKGNSTNPGVIVSVFDEQENKFSREAKLKSSVTCCYTPSVLAYYQLSQYLGGAGNVPETVIRTMDLAKHKKIRELGRRTPIASMWASWDKYYREQSPSVFISNKKQIYGSLADIAKNEMFFSEIYGSPSARTPEARLLAFQSTAIYKSMTNSAPLATLIPAKIEIPIIIKSGVGAISQNESLRRKMQWTQYVKDISDMVVLDSLLSQQDRFGNQHKKAYIYKIEGDKIKKHKVKAAKNSSGKAIGWRIGVEEKALIDQGGVLIQEFLMKDNDCGVKKTNIQMNAKTIEKVRHISPSSYFRLVKLRTAVKDEQALPVSKRVVENYFKTELLFTDSDMKSFYSNLDKVTSSLQKNCKAGLLKLDADVHIQLQRKEAPTSCELDQTTATFL
jgi:hypothetical protein